MDLKETKDALDRYDRENDDLIILIDSSDHSDPDQAIVILKKIEIVEEYARQIGLAYGNDTKEINNREDCERFIRPGVKEPVNEDDLSFVRKMVKRWEEDKSENPVT